MSKPKHSNEGVAPEQGELFFFFFPNIYHPLKMGSRWTQEAGENGQALNRSPCKGPGDRAGRRGRLVSSSQERRVTAGRHLLGHRAKGSSSLSVQLPTECGQNSVPKVNQKQGG